jgi:hypothetical protein
MFNKKTGSLLAAVALVASGIATTVPSSDAMADVGIQYRTCEGTKKCYSESVTSGTSSQTVRHSHNNVLSPLWGLTATNTLRGFTSQSGSVEVVITTTGALNSHGGACICVTYPCAV